MRTVCRKVCSWNSILSQSLIQSELAGYLCSFFLNHLVRVSLTHKKFYLYTLVIYNFSWVLSEYPIIIYCFPECPIFRLLFIIIHYNLNKSEISAIPNSKPDLILLFSFILMYILTPQAGSPCTATHHVTFKSLPVGHLIPGLRG